MSQTTGQPARSAFSVQATLNGFDAPMTRRVLPSGLRLLIDPIPRVHSVNLWVYLARGARHEGTAHAGIAHFVEHMLFKGTETRTAERLAQEVDAIGGHLDAFTAYEFAGYGTLTLDEHLPQAVDLLSDLLLRPTFPEDELVRERNVVLEEIKMVEDSPGDLVYELFSREFWPDHPLGRPILGTAQSVTRFDGHALRDYFGRAYRADNLIVAAAGNVDPDHLTSLVGEAFADVPPGGEPLQATRPEAAIRLDLYERRIEQVHICLGVSGYPYGHPDHHTLMILDDILGGTMSSRLFQQVRERRGLAYSVGSDLSAYRDAGQVTVYAACDRRSVGEVVDLIVAELRRLKSTPVPDDELQRARDGAKCNCRLAFESTSRRASNLGRFEMLLGRYVTIAEEIAAIDEVTVDDVQRVANDLFRTYALGGAVVGPLTDAIDPSRLALD